VQRTQIFVECGLNDKYQVRRTAISIRLRCAAPLRTSSAFFYKYYRDAVAFRFCYVVGLRKKNKVCLEIEKPYFQHVNLSRKAAHSIFTLLPYCSQVAYILNSRHITCEAFTVVGKTFFMDFDAANEDM
jgi:hypothetical protein